ncbi:AIM24 family protein, partial [Bifidobacterium pullorum subsp. saeculare]|nr:AIM24 family protein [Bifidobacterium pullorum subsp. saeculare]
MQYEIVSKAYPVVVCHLGPGEQMKTERGSMVWMDSWIDMATKTGDIGGVFERVLAGESIFQNVYTATRPGKVAFGSSFPGRIVPIAIAPGREFIVQKMGFLASEMGVELSMHVNQRIGGGFFGGEGF